MRYMFFLLILVACTVGQETDYATYGEQINASNVLGINDFLDQVNDTDQTFKVKGTIEEVCQMKGCWMTLKNESGIDVRVTFKDYGFFVPKDISGKEVIIEGLAKKELIDEETARHYAEDGGEEYKEDMRNSITFVAKGVLVSQS